MNFEWDDAKARSNEKKHGVPFELAARVFEDERRTDRIDQRKDYGEERHLTVGRVGSFILSVVYTERRGVIRIISARPANQKEKLSYGPSSQVPARHQEL